MNNRSKTDLCQELSEWRQTCFHAISHLTQVVPFPIPVSMTPCEERALLLELVSGVCDIVHSCPSNREFTDLSAKYAGCQAKLECVTVKSSELHKEVQELRAKLFRHRTIVEEHERERLASKVDEIETHILRQSSGAFVPRLHFPEIIPDDRMRILDDDSTCDLVKESRLVRKTARQCSAKIESSFRDCSAKRKHRRSERRKSPKSPKLPKQPPSALESLADIHRSLVQTEHILFD
jgi:hypothetical protein